MNDKDEGRQVGWWRQIPGLTSLSGFSGKKLTTQLSWEKEMEQRCQSYLHIEQANPIKHRHHKNIKNTRLAYWIYAGESAIETKQSGNERKRRPRICSLAVDQLMMHRCVSAAAARPHLLVHTLGRSRWGEKGGRKQVGNTQQGNENKTQLGWHTARAETMHLLLCGNIEWTL